MAHRLTPDQRSLLARARAYRQHAQGRTNTAPAREAFNNKKFIDQVDPDRTLPEAERNRRAELARKAYFTELSYRSAVSRARAKAMAADAKAAEVEADAADAELAELNDEAA